MVRRRRWVVAKKNKDVSDGFLDKTEQEQGCTNQGCLRQSKQNYHPQTYNQKASEFERMNMAARGIAIVGLMGDGRRTARLSVVVGSFVERQECLW